MDTTIYDKLSTISTIVSFLPPLIGLVFVRNLRGYLIPVLILALCGLLTDGINYALMQNGVSNLPLFHFYTILEFTLMSIVYYSFYKQYVKKNYIFLFMIPAFCVVAYIDYLLHGLNCIDNLSASIESVILTIYALISFLIIMNKLIFKNLLSAPFFWLNSGILLYFLGNLLIFAFSTYSTDSERVDTQAVWALHSILNIIFNLLICVAFWETRAK